MSSLINRYGPCVGISLCRWFQYRVELWFVPANYRIVEHTHSEEDIELVYIFGSCVFHRRDLRTGETREARMGLRRWLSKFSVKHYHSHWFSVSNWPLVFLNIQRFRDGYKPRSAADDFTETRIINWKV